MSAVKAPAKKCCSKGSANASDATPISTPAAGNGSSSGRSPMPRMGTIQDSGSWVAATISILNVLQERSMSMHQWLHDPVTTLGVDNWAAMT